MKKELTIIFLALFLATTVLAESSDIIIRTQPGEKAIVQVWDEYEKLSTPVGTSYDTGFTMVTVKASIAEVILEIKIKKGNSFTRNDDYGINIGENYELDFRGDSILEEDRPEPEPVATQTEEPEETAEENESNETNETNKTGNSTISGFAISDLNNNYVYITTTAIILAGISAFVIVKNKKKGPKIGKKKKEKTNHVIEKIKRKVTKEDHELKDIQDKIKQRQQMILQLKKEKERKERLKDAKEKLANEEKELRKLLREQKKPE